MKLGKGGSFKTFQNQACNTIFEKRPLMSKGGVLVHNTLVVELEGKGGCMCVIHSSLQHEFTSMLTHLPIMGLP